MHSLRYTAAFVIFCYSIAYAQMDTEPPSNEPEKIYQVHIKKTESEIKLDGILDEEPWKNAEVANNFWMKWPRDTEAAPKDTEVRLLYDDQFIYISAVCKSDGEYVIQTLKRDSEYFGSDGFGVILDPIGQKTNGFFFSVNPAGTQLEALITLDDFGTDWDNRWFVEVKQGEGEWVVEMAIPFKTLRYEAGKRQWAINFIRNDLKNNAYSVWSRVPINFRPFDLGYLGTLHWDQNPPVAKGNISIIPYAISSATRDYEEGTNWNVSANAGLDAKVALSSSLNLDLTVNPDFSQVEVDQQQTNLDRFSLFFPEQRNFFLENSDIFSNFGIPPVRPFFSRRIGLNNGQPISILGGARLTGNLSKNLRIGLMNLHTEDTLSSRDQNYTVAAFNHRVLKRSLIKGIFVNRQGFEDGKLNNDDYSRNGGLELEYLTKDGKWGAWGGYHLSETPEDLDDRDFINVGFFHDSKNVELAYAYNSIGTNYITEVGFNPRLDNYDAERDTTVRLGYDLHFTSLAYRFIIENGKVINRHGPSLEGVFITNPDGSLNERNHQLDYNFQFANTSELSIGYITNELNLPFPIDLFDGDEPLPARNYKFDQFAFSYSTDYRKRFFASVELQVGDFYNGRLNSISGELNYRIQPWGNFGMTINRSSVSLPNPYGNTDFWLVSPRIEIGFTRNIYWTTFLQYNTQNDNFNINSRFQWRFAPMSDLFVVYTDNYAVEQFGVNNRALVMKLNYWFTL